MALYNYLVEWNDACESLDAGNARVRQLRLRFPVRALVASGSTARADIARYLRLFDGLASEIGRRIPSGDEVIQARYLFDWLWQSKPQRYQPGGHFRLTDVLEAQISDGPGPVGNCLGLTALYNSLAGWFGIKVGAVHLERAFNHEIPHVFTMFQAGKRRLDIENVVPDGFDCSLHRDALGREKWGDKELTADIYLSRGNELFQAARWREAISCYDSALKLNPGYEKAALNRAMAVDQMNKA